MWCRQNTRHIKITLKFLRVILAEIRMSLPICDYRTGVPLNPRQAAAALSYTAGERPGAPHRLQPLR